MILYRIEKEAWWLLEASPFRVNTGMVSCIFILYQWSVNGTLVAFYIQFYLHVLASFGLICTIMAYGCVSVNLMDLLLYTAIDSPNVVQLYSLSSMHINRIQHDNATTVLLWSITYTLTLCKPPKFTNISPIYRPKSCIVTIDPYSLFLLLLRMMFLLPSKRSFFSSVRGHFARLFSRLWFLAHSVSPYFATWIVVASKQSLFVNASQMFWQLYSWCGPAACSPKLIF